MGPNPIPEFFQALFPLLLIFITARRVLYKCTSFLLSIKGQGSEEQKAKWLPLAESFQIIGTYAQTEIGHGEYEGL